MTLGLWAALLLLCPACAGLIDDRPGAKGPAIATLQADLLFAYKNSIPLNPSHGGPVVVSVDLEVRQILSLEKDTFRFNAWLALRWRDERLAWDPSAYAGIRSLRLPRTKVWTPDIVPATGKVVAEKAQASHVFVSNNGEMLWSRDVTIVSACSLDLRRFPFDSQNCSMKLSSWLHDGSFIDLRVGVQPVSGAYNPFPSLSK